MIYGRIASIFLAMFIALSSQTARAEQIALIALLPANATATSELSRLTVRPFGGPAGGVFSRAVVAALSVPDVNNAPYFVLSGTNADRSFRPEAVILGGGTVNISDQRYTQQVTDCASYKGFKCQNAVTRNVACTMRLISATFDLRIERVPTGEIIYSTTKPETNQVSWCEGQANTTSPDETLISLAQDAAERIHREIAPHAERYVVRVLETTQGISHSNVRIFKDLVRLSPNDITDSCVGWRKLAEEEPKSGALAYNVEICDELVRDYVASESDYRRSQGLFSDGKKEVAASISRSIQLASAKLQFMQQIEAKQRRAALQIQAPTALPKRKKR